jgi:hypothetical protein
VWTYAGAFFCLTFFPISGGTSPSPPHRGVRGPTAREVDRKNIGQKFLLPLAHTPAPFLPAFWMPNERADIGRRISAG